MAREDRRGKGGWDEVLATEAHRVAPGAEWRTAAMAVGVDRVAEASRMRAVYP